MYYLPYGTTRSVTERTYYVIRLFHIWKYLVPQNLLATQPPSPSSTIHAPISLLPSPIPRSLFEQTRQLHSSYNILFAQVAMDDDLLDKVTGAVVGVGKADEFVGTLWRGRKAIRGEGTVQVLIPSQSDRSLKSHYLLHTGEGDGKISLKQRAAAMHRYLNALTNYYGISPYLNSENFPPYDTTARLAEGLAAALKAYGVPKYLHILIPFVVYSNERKVFDQRWLEYELLEKHSIRVARQTFEELAASVALNSDTRALRLTVSPALSPSGSQSTLEVSTVYFRAGYAPSDCPPSTHYTTRVTLERNRAIHCPTISLRLAGGKKIQEFLSRPGVLKRFTRDANVQTVGTGTRDLRETWISMWSLDDPDLAVAPSEYSLRRSINKPRGTTLACALVDSLVLKPKREGGGNNTLPAPDLEAWIALQLIISPRDLGSYLIRAGATSGPNEDNKVVRSETVSESDIFGWLCFLARRSVRTKALKGSVAAGFSVLDSVVLIDG
ncbi:glutathione synthase [Pisolithus sp. B1]|nr:glutathione synthase [Pisolithus sp. B1]